MYFDTTASGNGIINRSWNYTSAIGNINNEGTVSGFNHNTSNAYNNPDNPMNHTSFSGNGIASFGRGSSASIDNVFNSGIITGFNLNFSNALNVSNGFNGNGILIGATGSPGFLNDINNTGIISGYDNFLSEKLSGNAIILNNGIIKNINNNGLLKSSNYAIFGNFETAINNGVIAAKNITNTNPIINNGVQITLNADPSLGVSIITNGTGGTTQIDGVNKTIVNATVSGTDSSITSSDSKLDAKKDLIINGAGVEKGALVVGSEFTLDDSIINGYNSAVYLENNSNFIANNTTFNGGGLKNDVAVIKGDATNNSLTLNGNSIINGAVDLGDGDDSLALGTSSIAKNLSNLNILHDITGFESINTNGNITLFETINITGANNININDGNLLLRVNPNIKDASGKIIGHALYGNSGTLTNTDGYLVIGLNGLGENSVISTGGTTITPSIDNNYWEDSDRLVTNSLVLDAKLDSNGDINITVFESLPIIPQHLKDPVLYQELNKIYQSIVSAGEIGILANTTLLQGKTYEEALGGLLTILDQIYANNP